jgi:hypothetical protein
MTSIAQTTMVITDTLEEVVRQIIVITIWTLVDSMEGTTTRIQPINTIHLVPCIKETALTRDPVTNPLIRPLTNIKLWPLLRISQAI